MPLDANWLRLQRLALVLAAARTAEEVAAALASEGLSALSIARGAESGPLGVEERAFVEAVAPLGALAFDRARLYEAERQAREAAEQRQERLETEQRENESRARDFFGNL